MAKQDNQSSQQDKLKDLSKPADDLVTPSALPVEELSDEQLDKVSGGALSSYVVLPAQKQGEIKGP